MVYYSRRSSPPEKQQQSRERNRAVRNFVLVLRSLNAITKESAIMAVIFGRPTPDPRFGPSVELLRRDASGLLDLFGVGKALPGKRIAAKEAPPALLQIEPARSGRNEDVMQAWMP